MRQEVKGVSYHYEWLNEYDWKKKTLVCLHGFTGTSATFKECLSSFAAYNILAIDLLGHGQSDSPAQAKRYEIESIAQDVTALLTLLGLDSFSLLGYSMGGRVAISVALLNSRRCETLIIEGGSPGIESEHKRAERQKRDICLATWLLTVGIEEFVNYWEALPLFATQRTLALEKQLKIRKERLSQDPFGLACSLKYMGTGSQPSYWAKLGQLTTIRLLYIVGENDHKFQQIAEQMQELVPSLTISKHQTGHCVHVERPDEFRLVVQKFLKGEAYENSKN
ncbi:2-succinyl-6-hydroxy-2,4-cyclohexadiene-1-carboxylate synthase [Vagococcus entomophilus]|uniref:Putative 2-succinyl-6-hydroxy-2,4-cyclohexadiene-1-carboxylate synthase n=1 Tax=Vagococcus entomophilus TaxID=1160095 RepID=A0A430AFE8_9ENTE|nr:2-succinyl-6-hydroxy-2,4-cyclohexadiene-1-carboxylate synthase [Vagococcus entomophilus]RSU06473.1 2-succinyl-6-hydroxy-2,4-cyclohexadiene-1-carboxylate synthase [Vagococcus entomophilus]